MGIDDFLKDITKEDVINAAPWYGEAITKKGTSNMPVPFPVLCDGKTGKMSESCQACPNRHRGMCMQYEANKMAAWSNSFIDQKRTYDISAEQMMSDLVVKILNGTPWLSIKEWLRSHYASDELNRNADLLNLWLSTPGILGHIIVDPMFFGDCVVAQQKLSRTQFRPMMMLQGVKCIDCIKNVNDGCSRIGIKFASKSYSVDEKLIVNRIDQIRQAGMLSQDTAVKCRAMAVHDPLRSISTAARCIGRVDECNEMLDIFKSLNNLGQIVDSKISSYENEPVESVEAKMFLTGNAFPVEIDPPIHYKYDVNESQIFSPGTGIDDYFK